MQKCNLHRCAHSCHRAGTAFGCRRRRAVLGLVCLSARPVSGSPFSGQSCSMRRPASPPKSPPGSGAAGRVSDWFPAGPEDVTIGSLESTWLYSMQNVAVLSPCGRFQWYFPHRVCLKVSQTARWTHLLTTPQALSLAEPSSLSPRRGTFSYPRAFKQSVSRSARARLPAADPAAAW